MGDVLAEGICEEWVGPDGAVRVDVLNLFQWEVSGLCAGRAKEDGVPERFLVSSAWKEGVTASWVVAGIDSVTILSL